MESSTIHKRVNSIRTYLEKREIKKAIDEVEKLVSPQNNWSFHKS